MKQIFTAVFLLITTYGISQSNTRYSTPIFNDYNVYENIIYGEAKPFNLELKSVTAFYSFDFYEPAQDRALNRPLVLLFSDGNFIVGDKEQNEIVNWCKELTTYGYTCACVNYRQGYDANSQNGMNEAMYRGVQDARAAVRYFIEYEKTFRIDTDKIYLGGIKTGAVIAIHTAFMDKEEECPTSALHKEDCLDCSGNPFDHQVKIAGVLNIDGSIYDPKIVRNNQNISILNIQLKDAEETENTPVLGHTIGADIIEGFSSQYSTSFLHEHLDSLNFKSDFQIIKGKNLFKGFVNEAITDKITIITNFLSNDLKFQTKQPIGKSVVCENTTSFFNINFEKNCKYEWAIENGTIIDQKENKIEVKWNKGSGVGKVFATKINEAGLRGIPSEPLNITITPQPIADFEINYLSENTVLVKDKSLDANLFSIDFGYNGQMQQGRPNTNASFSYPESGAYFLTQTVENICGVATQLIPIEISIPPLYKDINIEEVSKEVPTAIQKGEHTSVDISKLNNIEKLFVVIKNDYYNQISRTTFQQTGTIKNLPINTEQLEVGVYFIEFLVGEHLLMTKRIRVQ